MSTYTEHLTRTADRLGLRSGQSLRITCPSCGGYNTCSITRKAGALLWNCFRASCRLRGGKDVPRSAEEIADTLRNGLREEARAKPFSIPPHWTSLKGDAEALRYIRNNHCSYAYENKLADLLLDPRTRRVVFLTRHEGRIVDAVGRALDRKVQPKWWRYGNHPAPFSVKPLEGEPDVAVIVEDAASACAVAAAGVSGVAILGTTLRTSTARIMRDKYREYIVALDKDASVKALDMQRQLSVYGKSRVLLLEQDLKYMNRDAVRDLIYNNNKEGLTL